MLTMFTDKAYLPPNTGYSEILFHHWGPIQNNEAWGKRNIYEEYVNGPPPFALTNNPTEADYALLPNDWKRYERSDRINLAKAFNTLAMQHNLTTLVLFHSDFDYPLPLQNYIALRTSAQTPLRKSDRLIPGWNGDLLTDFNNGNVLIRRKGNKPVIGFCGVARANKQPLLVRVKNELKKYIAPKKYRFNALRLRYQLIQSLEKHEGIITNFDLKHSYLGGINQTTDSEQINFIRKSYYQNTINSDYVLCVRGAGNFSYRFYETLALGRIPVFINTRNALPLDWVLPYKKYMVWVEENEMHLVGDKLIQFHQNISNSEFELLQKQLRQLWKDYLSPEGFMQHLNQVLLHE